MDRKQRLTFALRRNTLRLCWILFFLGILWVFLHPAITVTTGELKCRGTYISENELLVGGAEPTCSDREADEAKNLHESFMEIPHLPPNGCRDNCTKVLEWFDEQFDSITNIETYRQTFTRNQWGGENWTVATNAYAILRATPLSDGKESILLVTHYRNVGTQRLQAEYSGLVMGMTLLKFLADAKWLAKDVILLMADDGDHDGNDGFSQGTESWLRGYHLDPFDQANENSVTMRAGVIRAALNLDTSAGALSAGKVGIFTSGTNGQLPNLDLINTAVEAFHDEHISVTIDVCHKLSAPCDGDLAELVQKVATWMAALLVGEQSANEYGSNLLGMLRFMRNMVSGPSGTHANFVSYNIDSITISPIETANPTRLPLVGMLRATEAILRSVSNTEEKFHQSFFLYVLPNVQTFVSVGEYYYALALVLCPISIHLLSLSKNSTGKRICFGLLSFACVELVGMALLVLSTTDLVVRELESLVVQTSKPSHGHSVLCLLALVCIVFAQAICIKILLPAISALSCTKGCLRQGEWQKRLDRCEEVLVKAQNPDQTIQTDSNNVALSSSSSPPRKGKESITAEAVADENDPGWKTLKCFMLALIVFAHYPLGIINYPLALVGALSTAWSALAYPLSTMSISGRFGFLIVLFVSSPVFMSLLLLWTDYDAALASTLFVIKGFTKMSLLTLPYLCCVYFPVHTLALAISRS